MALAKRTTHLGRLGLCTRSEKTLQVPIFLITSLMFLIHFVQLEI